IGSYNGRGAGVGRGLGVGVVLGGDGGGVPTPSVPTRRNSWSGPFWVGRQVVLRPQVGQLAPKPPPGFCQAAPELDITDRLSQNHSQELLKSSRACTDTQ